MRNSRKWISDARPTMGKILIAFVLVVVMGGILMALSVFAKDHRGRHGHWRHHQHWRHYGYYHGHPYQPYEERKPEGTAG